MSQPLKVFELFAGFGGASFALKKAGIEFETVGYSEIDKYAIQCYDQNHKGKNYGDCTKINVDNLPDFDLLTGGFPCQSFSIAGKGLGEQDTRGTLFNEIIRIAEAKQPKYMLLENVKGLMSKKHKDTFDKICSELNRIGYEFHIKVLNSKDYGIPQNRERVWFVCCRKDIPFHFDWPEKEELKIFLKYILEDEVDEKYYLSDERVEQLLSKTHTFHTRRFQKEISNTLLARDYKDPKLVQVNNPSHSNNRVYDPKGISPTLNCMSGGNRQPFIHIKNATKKVYQTNDQRGVVTDDMSIRKLTPTECFRLMGFLDDEINLEGLSNTQRYKLAGNGWDINVVSKIFKCMFNHD